MIFKKIKSNNQINNLIKIAALLIHTAKIDEDYSSKEKNIIEKTLLKIGASNENIERIIDEAIKITYCNSIFSDIKLPF